MTSDCRICAVVDLVTRYPIQTWFEQNPYAHESNFVPQVLECIPAQTLLVLDRGFWNFGFFEQLIKAQSDLITRLKAKAQYQSLQVLSQSSTPKRPINSLGNGLSR